MERFEKIRKLVGLIKMFKMQQKRKREVKKSDRRHSWKETE